MKQLLLLSVLIFIGCKSEPESVENISENQEKSYTIKAEDIEKLEYTDYILSPESAEAILDWQNYQELQTQIELLKSGNLSFFRVEKEIMQTFITELNTQQPPIVVTPAIRSRMTVLETTLLRLQDLSNLDNIKKKVLLEAIKELLLADVNLKLQMNKKFEKEAQQIQIPVRTE
ncbi:hypothetical protein LX77_02070 [Gelidibacter algens]|uniref:Lipoprotein n=1 Tax=Gelidibacter algens TaxID=49280 RepID=A0A1A7R3N9_9FLAO|nr:hypothetical protein [Gelidibacter algens]OBX26123.1 hypothetical protein A9996_06235 [Gelidibacter algens]RAJ24516.1 hypothetical protein LX77_02070 [Gelidibacter algens]